MYGSKKCFSCDGVLHVSKCTQTLIVYQYLYLSNHYTVCVRVFFFYSSEKPWCIMNLLILMTPLTQLEKSLLHSLAVFPQLDVQYRALLPPCCFLHTPLIDYKAAFCLCMWEASPSSQIVQSSKENYHHGIPDKSIDAQYLCSVIAATLAASIDYLCRFVVD